MTAPAKCLGLLGWLFGHKYLGSKSGYVFESDFCFRCGRHLG